MLNLTSSALKIFLALDPCDMRKSFNGLQALASDPSRAAPNPDALFVFIFHKVAFRIQSVGTAVCLQGVDDRVARFQAAKKHPVLHALLRGDKTAAA